MKTTLTCSYCETELETNSAGLAGHQRKCRKARQWQRNFFRERGKWPSSKDKRIPFARGSGGHRGGRSPGVDKYDS